MKLIVKIIITQIYYNFDIDFNECLSRPFLVSIFVAQLGKSVLANKIATKANGTVVRFLPE